MSKIRLILAEMEGPDDSIRSVLSGLLETIHEPQRTSIEPPASPLPQPKQLATVAKRRMNGNGNGHVKPVVRLESKNGAGGGLASDDGTRSKVLALLGKKPMTSGELIKALQPGLTSGAVYSILHVLRKEGVIRSVDDPDGIAKKNVLAVPK